MRIAAITKFKHGALFELLKELGWSQAEFAERSGLHKSTMGSILNLRQRPTEQSILKMEVALANANKFVDVSSMFPSSYIGFSRSLVVTQVQDIEPDKLEAFRQNQIQLLKDAQPPIPIDVIDTEEKLSEIQKLLNDKDTSLTKKQIAAVRRHFIQGETISSIATDLGVSNMCIRNRLNVALKKLRRNFQELDRFDEHQSAKNYFVCET